jgi:hypothetical protein
MLWSGCGGESLDPGTGGNGSSGSGSGSEVCTPGEKAACYEGPAGTKGVGVCAAGTHVCNEQGTGHGPCTGQVLPSLEVCPGAQDEDCNGQTDELGCASLKVSQIDAGGVHTCARLSDGSVKCWGINSNGELGLGIRPIVAMGRTSWAITCRPWTSARARQRS